MTQSALQSTDQSLPWIFIFQGVAILITIASWHLIQEPRWYIVMYAFGFCHYLMALYYSKQNLIHAVSTHSGIGLFILIAVIGAMLYQYEFHLIWYFGLHHALSEAYFRPRYKGLGLTDSRLSRLQTMSFIFHICGYLMLVKTHFLQNNPAWMIGIASVLSISFLLLLIEIYRVKKEYSIQKLLNALGSELLVLLVIPFAFYIDIGFTHIVFYHFAFWALLPFVSMPRRASKSILNQPLTQYVLWSVLLLVVFLTLSPIFYRPTPQWRIQYFELFIIFSYIHITLSFSVSRLNPSWINNRFVLKKAV